MVVRITSLPIATTAIATPLRVDQVVPTQAPRLQHLTTRVASQVATVAHHRANRATLPLLQVDMVVASRHTVNHTANSTSNQTMAHKLDLGDNLAMAAAHPATVDKAHHLVLLEAMVNKLAMAVLPATAVHPAVTTAALQTTTTLNTTSTAVARPMETNTGVGLANILLLQDSTQVATAVHRVLIHHNLAGNRPPQNCKFK